MKHPSVELLVKLRESKEPIAGKPGNLFPQNVHPVSHLLQQNRPKFGFFCQVCQAGHDVTYERQCAKTCKEKKEKEKGPLKSLISGIKVENLNTRRDLKCYH